MIIAIHNGKGGFHPRWIAYCVQNNIPYKLVNCYMNDLIDQLKECNALMWHHWQSDPKDIIAAKPILFALEQAGVKVFPNFNTNWHFDDKLGQKYIFESLKIPFVPTYVFYEKISALEWAASIKFPKVFKLRGGAGSANVKLVNNHTQAKRLIKQAFGKGFNNYDALGNLKEQWRKWRLGKNDLWDLVKGLLRLFHAPAFAKLKGKESGYVYFQDFIPNNSYDIRIVVIGDKAFAIKRMVRKNDFRASGSGHILYEKEIFSYVDIELAFFIHDKLKSQCTAMDFVYDNGQPKIVEISFGFDPKGYEACPGYWDSEINWHQGKFDPYGWMVEEVLKKV